ncbi:hypothetical protein [Yinghuangia sp. YIM S09857]|uniref:hypothetical protein n=1 Tax=Yinghuangia sp. YIM S09857 TaxID=3436929 RepID=UPI003F530DD1
MSVYPTGVRELIRTATLPEEIAELLADTDLPPEAKPLVEAKLAVAERLAGLGDPLNDCVALVSPQALIGAVWRLPTAERSSLLRDLMIPPARKPTRTAAAHALTLLRRFDPVRRHGITQALTRPMMDVLLPDGAGSQPSADSLRQTLANVTFDRSLVRLAALAWWSAGPAAAGLLRAGLLDGGFAPDNWDASVVVEVADACAEFVAAFTDLTICSQNATVESPVEAPDADLDAGDEPELRPLDEAVSAARHALRMLGDALADGRPPADADIACLERVRDSFAIVRVRIAQEVGLPVEEIPQDRPGMAAQLRTRRAAARDEDIGDLQRAAGLVGPPGRADSLAEVRSIAADLAANAPAWNDDQRRHVTAVTHLVRLVDAVGSEADDSIIDTLEERARTALPDAALITAALRGQLSFAMSEEPKPAVPATSTSLADSVEAVAPGFSGVGPEPTPEGTEREGPAESADNSATATNEEPHEAEAPASADMTAEEATALFAGLIDDRRLGLAYHLACTDAFAAVRTSEHTAGCAEIVRACAYAESVRSDSGPLAELLRIGLDGIDPALLRSSRVTQLLAVAAGTRAAVLCGQFTHELLRGALAGLSDLPALCDVTAHVATASEQGALARPDRLLVLTPLADADRLVQGSAAAAEAELHRVRTYSFARANVIAGRWWHPETGLIGRLLAAAAENDRSRVTEVATELRRLNKSGTLEDTLAAVDRDVREGGTPRLEGAARNRLLDSARESLTFVRQWAEDAQRAAAATGTDPWATRPLQELREALIGHREAVHAEMDLYAARTSDLVIAAVVRFVRQSVDTTIGLFDGRTLSGPDPEAALLLNAELLRCPRVSLTDDGTLRAKPVPADIAEAAGTDAPAAFRARVDAADFGGARLLAESLSRSDRHSPDDPPKDWFQQITESQELAQRELRARHDVVARAVDSAARHGRLVDADRSRLGAALAAADVERSDLGTVRAELREIEDALSACAALAGAALREDLAKALLENEGKVADVREAVEARIEEGDFATAEEYLLIAKGGDPLPEGENHDELAEYFPSVPDAMPEGLTDAVVEAAEIGSRFGPLDYTRLGTDERRSVGEAFRVWRDAKQALRTRRGDPAGHLRAPLRMAGIEYAGWQPSPDLQDTPPQRRWVDLVTVRLIGHPLVPTFGSKSGDRLRLLLVRDVVDVRTIVSWVRQDVSDVPVLVCLFGALSAANRRQLADEAVRNRDKPFAVLDDTALAYLGSRGHGRVNAMTRLLLPFAAVNPYCPGVAESVPTEMFYGRHAERGALADLEGTSLIYGGRQFGKSALLRATERYFDGMDGCRGIYVCLPGAGDGSDTALREAWSRIGGTLTECGVITRKKGDVSPFDADNVGRDVRAWLHAEPRRRLLLLLDECDAFFEADAKTGFRETARLRDLMNDTGRRFKVVFAGLHQVQRFAGLPNQPLADAHFGKSTVIGPLKPKAAHDLLRVPTEALGIQFESDALIHHVLTHCYYQPKLLQLAGEAIVDAVLALREEALSEPPYVVDKALLDRVLSSETFRTSVATAIELTLNLDSRYKLIALVMAHRAHEGQHGTTTTAELRAECRNWWHAGFESSAPEEFRALLEEMVGLGVLARVSDQAWRVRSSNVLRMLGTADEVINALCSDRWATITHLSAAASRTRLRNGSTSPLTWRQTQDLLGERANQVRIVVGTRATGVGEVATALREAADSASDRFDFLAPKQHIDYRKGLLNAKSDGRHLVLVDDLTGFDGDQHVIDAVKAALDSTPSPENTRAVSIIVDACDPDVLMAVTDPELGADPGSVVSLTRLSRDGVRAWGTEDGRTYAFSTEADVQALLEHTGGWPILLNLVETQFTEPGESAAGACARLDRHLRTPQGAAWFLDATGVTADPHVSVAWRTIVELDEAVPRDVLIEFLAGDGIGSARADALLDALLALDLLIPSPDGLRPEPVAARAWHQAPGRPTAG